MHFSYQSKQKYVENPNIKLAFYKGAHIYFVIYYIVNRGYVGVTEIPSAHLDMGKIMLN